MKWKLGGTMNRVSNEKKKKNEKVLRVVHVAGRRAKTMEEKMRKKRA